MRKHMQKWRLVYMEQNKINGNNNTEVKCCCCGGNVKKTERAEKDKKKLVNRLSRIEGQIRGIKKMIENDAYCNDVLIQSAAVGAAINAFNRELLSNHIHSCVVRDIREGKDEVVDELMVTLQKLIK
jgi:DNA-binding FrmR family transcriptional regulator